MKFEALLERFGGEAYFDYASVALLFPESPEAIRTSLYRFRGKKRLLELRRGLYAFSERYRKVPLTGPRVADILYPPSYLSERWALSFHGVIPEAVPLYTSVTPRGTKRFENSWGRFIYRSIVQKLFSGYLIERIMGFPIRIAGPEKALLDLWYLETGEWTEERMESMRFEAGAVSLPNLVSLTKATEIPRLIRAAAAFRRYAEGSLAGRVEI